MATKHQAEVAARRRWGKTGFVREDRRALTPEQRHKLSDELKEITRREKGYCPDETTQPGLALTAALRLGHERQCPH
jgi:hypothetical protein